jgi:transcriptional regulator with XRE-family HTH domain
MPELLGKVLWFVRHGLDVSQQDVADWLAMPASTVSKLELGTITAAVHHLDALARAFTHFEAQDRGDAAQGWEGWELHRVTTRLAEALAEKGYVVLWAEMPEGADETLYCRGRKIAAVVRDCWPGREG